MQIFQFLEISKIWNTLTPSISNNDSQVLLTTVWTPFIVQYYAPSDLVSDRIDVLKDIKPIVVHCPYLNSS